MSILLNNEQVKIQKDDLPMLISGKRGSGSSKFSIRVILDFVLSGNKVLFFTAFPPAKRDFKSLLDQNNITDVEFVEDFDQITEEQVIVLNSAEGSDFIQTLKFLTDLEERVVLLKNMDAYDQNVYDVVCNLKNVVVSGDIDKTVFDESLTKKEFSTKIFFNQSAKYPIDDFNQPGKYQAVVIGKRLNRVIKLGQKS